MKKLLFMMSMLFLLSFGMTGCSSDDDSSMSNNERKDISITRSEESLVHQNNDFSFRLLRTVQGEESRILSPLSVTMVLGMLNNGATGETQQQINDSVIPVSRPSTVSAGNCSLKHLALIGK